VARSLLRWLAGKGYKTVASAEINREKKKRARGGYFAGMGVFLTRKMELPKKLPGK